jgi:hypothetical protein
MFLFKIQSDPGYSVSNVRPKCCACYWLMAIAARQVRELLWSARISTSLALHATHEVTMQPDTQLLLCGRFYLYLFSLTTFFNKFPSPRLYDCPYSKGSASLSSWETSAQIALINGPTDVQEISVWRCRQVYLAREHDNEPSGCIKGG